MLLLVDLIFLFSWPFLSTWIYCQTWKVCRPDCDYHPDFLPFLSQRSSIYCPKHKVLGHGTWENYFCWCYLMSYSDYKWEEGRLGCREWAFIHLSWLIIADRSFCWLDWFGSWLIEWARYFPFAKSIIISILFDFYYSFLINHSKENIWNFD